MKSDRRVASRPPKPLMVFDGECHFCGLWIKRWRQTTGDAIDYFPFQDPTIARGFPELPREKFETAVHLIEPDGSVYHGAEAAFRALAKNPASKFALDWYEASPFFARSTEAFYRFVAKNRPLFSWLTRIGWGQHTERQEHFLVRGIFLRGLGLIYLVAFLSLSSQIIGLVGSNGIEPAGEFLTRAKGYFVTRGVEADRFHQLPTLCWFNASDGFLRFQCAAGVALAVTLLIGIAPALCLFLLWLVYLSLCCVGGVFLGFQWDALLLETGLFAIFLAPRSWLPRGWKKSPPPRISLWLLRWLLFRLMFQSGVTKLVYDDPTWSDFTALTFHYETQPLPTWIAWHVHQLPAWFHELSCAVMYAIEIAVPFLFLAPRRLRIFGAVATVLFQLLIGLTGNYTFFNLLTILLCVPLLDDFALQRFTPRALRRFLATHPSPSTNPRPAWRTRGLRIFAAFTVLVTTIEMFSNLHWINSWPKPLEQLVLAVQPFRSLNHYGLFRVMTRPRYELIVEGSNDGATWLPYEFKWKPGDVKRRPRFVAPHQPRLDWQMWFAALSEARQNPWFVNFCVRLLQGSPEVLALLERNPFPDKPPRHIRAVRYDYHFTTPAERRATGAWWKREERDLYLPAISLELESHGK
jgi:lipase maturation factor 1